MCEQGGVDSVRVGLIGCGTVGAAFAEVLRAERRTIAERYGVWLDLVDVAVAHPDRARPSVGSVRVHGDGLAVAERSDIDVVVEASTARAAGSWLRAALSRGAAVVTANKAALASDPVLLGELIAPTSWLWCEAAVGGAVPIVRGVRESLAGTAVRAIRGILNGTTTFVLSRMEQGGSFGDAVRAAQRAGYAEADPTADLSGADAAAKLAILSTLVWREPLVADDVITRGVDASTLAEFGGGCRVRLVASASRSEATGIVRAFVAPIALASDDALYAAHDVDNVVEVETLLAGTWGWRGPGAGGSATASALLSDTIAAARALTHRGIVAARA